MKQTTEKKYNSIEKAIRILLEFKEEKPDWGVRELSQELGFSPATVQRILQTLKASDFVDQDPQSRQYFLGNVFYRFIQTLNSSSRVNRAARRYMSMVATQTRETVHLNIIDGEDRICISTMESTRNLRAGMPMGHRSPLYAGASAKCLLAFSPPDFIKNYMEEISIKAITDNTISNLNTLEKELKTIRAQGYAVSLAERTQGLGSISAPVLDHTGTVQASLSVALPEIRFSDPDHLKSCINILMEAAGSFSTAMGFIP
jgi:DNA-binding IclR family transcriptional regulator